MADLSNQYSRRRRISGAAALLVAGVVVGCTALVLLVRGGGGDDGGGQAAPGATAAADTAAAVDVEPVRPGDRAVDTPADVRWQLFEGVALPFSASAGPTRVDEPIAAGYARSPAGALLAASQLTVRYLVTPHPDWRRVVKEQVLPGPGRDAFLAQRGRYAQMDAPAAGFGQFAGFRFVTYTDDVAVVQLVTRFHGDVLQATTNTVRWVDGDWRLELQPDGATGPPAQRLPNLLGVTAWRGV